MKKALWLLSGILCVAGAFLCFFLLCVDLRDRLKKSNLVSFLKKKIHI